MIIGNRLKMMTETNELVWHLSMQEINSFGRIQEIHSENKSLFSILPIKQINSEIIFVMQPILYYQNSYYQNLK